MTQITAATYLPESMIIGIGPVMRIVDENGTPEAFPTAATFGFFFHEYSHYLHNISTASGIAVFINTIELWRCFRLTMSLHGHGAGSAALSQDQRSHLAELLAYLRSARQKHDPALKLIQSANSVMIYSLATKPDAAGAAGAMHSILVCEVDIADDRRQVERQTVKIGTLELLEGAAWLLEKRMVAAISSDEESPPAPFFPYRIVKAVVEYMVPGIDEEGVLACILTALQSSDAPAALESEVIPIIRQAVTDGRSPTTELRKCAANAIAQNHQQLEGVFASLEKEFQCDGVMAIAIRRIIAAAKAGFAARREDPFFELAIIQNLATRKESINDVLRRIPSCAVLQKNPGDDNGLRRDFLLSFLPATDDYGQDPENGLRVVHSIFHYVCLHWRGTDFAKTEEVNPCRCPFYTCCDLSLRRTDPSICKATPWKSVDWSGWDGAACWYATGIRITRPPS